MDRRQIAFHEAGHVVIAYRLGLPTNRVTIEPDGNTLGICQTEATWSDGAFAEENILTDYAGYAAECLCNPTASRDGSDSDEMDAAELIEQFPGRTEAELRDHAARMVAAHRDEIEAVAEALMRYTMLEAFESEIICDAIDEEKDWRIVLDEYRQRRGEGV